MNEHELPLEDTAEKYAVPGLERGLRLLCEFSRQQQTLSAPELAKRLGVPRSTVFRLLVTLERMGFIERAEGGRDYRLGMAVLRLGFEYLASLELTEIGRPLLDRLREQIGYSCNLVVRDGRSIVYVAKSVSPTPFPSSVNVGTRLPAHGTVLGRVLLQDLSLAQLQELYPAQTLEAFTDNTPATVPALYAMLEQDRARGYVLQEGFFERGISTVAAPVRDHTGQVVAALGATIPAPLPDAAHMDDVVRQVRASAAELSRLLNHAPAHPPPHTRSKPIMAMINLQGQVAVVTGGSSGIGLATVELLLEAGAAVALCGRDAARLAAAEAGLRARFPNARLLAAERAMCSMRSRCAAFAEHTAQRAAAPHRCSSTMPARAGSPPSPTPPIAPGSRNCT